MTPLLSFTRPIMSEPWAPDVVRLVVVDGGKCSNECPHRHIGKCGAFGLPLNTLTGHRLKTCITSTLELSGENERAQRAFDRFKELRARKVDMTKVAKKDTTEKPKANDLKETRKDTRHLKVILTPEELEQRADLSSHIWAEHCATETEAKTIASNFKSKVAELRGKHDTLQREIRDKCTYKDVECEMLFDYESRKVTVRRGDTGMVVEERDMLSEEFTIWQAKRKQLKMPFVEDKKDDALTKATEQVQAELDDEADRTASELKSRAKKSKRNA